MSVPGLHGVWSTPGDDIHEVPGFHTCALSFKRTPVGWVGTHPFPKHFWLQGQKAPGMRQGILWGHQNALSCCFTHYTSVVCLNFTSCTYISFGWGKKTCESVSHHPPSGGNHCKWTLGDLGVEAYSLEQCRLSAAFRIALLCNMRGNEGPILQCRYLKVVKVK